MRSYVVRLAHRSLGVDDFAHEAATVVRRAVPADGVCLLTRDPATLLPTSECVQDGLPTEAMPRLGEIERREPDVNKFTALAQRAVPAASLSGRHPRRPLPQPSQRELRGPSGFADELRVALRDTTPELAPLLVAAYSLTERERVVTELVARGLTTNQIAARLRVGAYTLQDHLKSIFHKSGTGSRGELVARLFLDHMPALAPPPPSGRDTG